MPDFNVIFHPTIRVRINNVRAESHEEAAAKALTFYEEVAHRLIDRPTHSAELVPQDALKETYIQYVEHAEDEHDFRATVDVVGDDEYLQTQTLLVPTDDPNLVIEWTPELIEDMQAVITKHHKLQGRKPPTKTEENVKLFPGQDPVEVAFAGFENALRTKVLETKRERSEEENRKKASIELCKALREKFESYGFETVSDMGGETDWDDQFRFHLSDDGELRYDVEVEAYEGRLSIGMHEIDGGEVKAFASAADPRNLTEALEGKAPFVTQLSDFLEVAFLIAGEELSSKRIMKECQPAT